MELKMLLNLVGVLEGIEVLVVLLGHHFGQGIRERAPVSHRNLRSGSEWNYRVIEVIDVSECYGCT